MIFFKHLSLWSAENSRIFADQIFVSCQCQPLLIKCWFTFMKSGIRWHLWSIQLQLGDLFLVHKNRRYSINGCTKSVGCKKNYYLITSFLNHFWNLNLKNYKPWKKYKLKKLGIFERILFLLKIWLCLLAFVHNSYQFVLLYLWCSKAKCICLISKYIFDRWQKIYVILLGLQ